MKLPIGDILKGADALVDNLTTTKEELRQFDLEEKKLDHERLSDQTDINKEEAKHKSVFVAGWRPAIGWVGAVAFAYQFILYPLLVWAWSVAQAKGWIDPGIETPPILDIEALMTLLMGMLGLGVMRSYDKSKGTSTESISGMSMKEIRIRKKLERVQSR